MHYISVCIALCQCVCIISVCVHYISVCSVHFVQFCPYECVRVHAPVHRLCTQRIGNAAYIVYVTPLVILGMVTARGKLAGITNDKESVLL